MKFSEEEKKKYNKGNGIKKLSCNERPIRLEALDLKAVERINQRVIVAAKQNQAGRQQSEILAKGLFSD